MLDCNSVCVFFCRRLSQRLVKPCVDSSQRMIISTSTIWFIVPNRHCASWSVERAQRARAVAAAPLRTLTRGQPCQSLRLRLRLGQICLDSLKDYASGLGGEFVNSKRGKKWTISIFSALNYGYW